MSAPTHVGGYLNSCAKLARPVYGEFLGESPTPTEHLPAAWGKGGRWHGPRPLPAASNAFGAARRTPASEEYHGRRAVWSGRILPSITGCGFVSQRPASLAPCK